MPDHASPAARLRDVVVTHDQSGMRWRASGAAIQSGRIVVTATPATLPPEGLLENPASTFTITAVDAGRRARLFPYVKLDAEATEPGRRYVFV